MRAYLILVLGIIITIVLSAACTMQSEHQRGDRVRLIDGTKCGRVFDTGLGPSYQVRYVDVRSYYDGETMEFVRDEFFQEFEIVACDE